MAAAFAAVMSLMNTIDLILQKDRFLILDSDEELRSLQEKATMMQIFLEESSRSTDEEVKRMAVRIRDAANEAHDIIDSYISNFILESKRIPLKFILQYERIQDKFLKATKQIACISKEVKLQGYSRDLPSNNFLPTSLSSTSVVPSSTMIGFKRDLLQIKSRLTGNQSGLQIIPIVGMGGAGKTTLARNVYDDSLIVHHFHVRAWATVSQVYDTRDIILTLLGSDEKLQKKSTKDLELDLYQRLKGRRYLITLDDVWDTELCDHIRRWFPNDNVASRIILTTRQQNVAEYIGLLSSSHHMSFLGEDVSWNLLKNKVFGQEDCPSDLENIGRVIARNCKGLPLAIVVTGGYLAKAEKTAEHWRAFGENLKSVIGQNEEQCMGILYLSYSYLPSHLKPCFLYMGAFPEDDVVNVTTLVHLWVAEGFLKPVYSKSLTEVAHEYVEDLIDRNLILAHEQDFNGKAKSCKIHDVLRELCLREANEESFLYVFGEQVHEGTVLNDYFFTFFISQHRRLAICKRYDLNDYPELPSARNSLICSTGIHFPPRYNEVTMKIVNMLDLGFEFSRLQRLVNLRYIASTVRRGSFIPSLSLYWNLQTLIFRNFYGQLPSDIWEMSELRYIDISSIYYVSAPPIAGDSAPLENLEIIYGVDDMKWTEETIRKLPNLKKLKISYPSENPWDDKHLYNLRLLQKLEELHCRFPSSSGLRHSMMQWLPESLKELTLEDGKFPWSAMTNIGSLPNLQVLRIWDHAFFGAEWEPNEGEFLQLKVLELGWLDLEHWRAESSHFPLLRHLVLYYCRRLMEIPSSIGEITTLEKIDVSYCRRSCEESAIRIQDEQLEDYGNDNLQIFVWNS